MLKYAESHIKNAAKNIKGKGYDNLKSEISDLRETIKKLESKTKTPEIEERIKLNMISLADKENELKAIERAISSNKLSPQDTQFISDRMTNFKDVNWYRQKYDNYLNDIRANGKTPNMCDMRKAVDYAEREQAVELVRALNKIADLENKLEKLKLKLSKK